MEADLAAARAGRPYKLSDGCSPEKITAKSTRDVCEVFRKLEGELETGKAAARLDETAATIRDRLARGMAVQTVDPGATAVSLIVGASAENVAAWSALLGSVALELAGMIAMMRAERATMSGEGQPVPTSLRANVSRTTALQNCAVQAPHAHRYTEASTPRKRAAISAVTLIDARKASAGGDTIGRFMLACLKREPGEEAQGGAIYSRYQRWCSEQQPVLATLDPRAFAQKFAERCERVGIRTRRDGRKVYCLDVMLVARIPMEMVMATCSKDEGVLKLHPSGRWAVCRPGRPPVQITSGDVFRIQVDGMPGLQVTRMEFRHFQGPMKVRNFRGLSGEYYSVDGYWLRGGLRAAIGEKD